jgi:hypothetical protein
MRLQPHFIARPAAVHSNKKAQAHRLRFRQIHEGEDYSPTAVARSVFSTMRADLPRRLRR